MLAPIINYLQLIFANKQNNFAFLVVRRIFNCEKVYYNVDELFNHLRVICT